MNYTNPDRKDYLQYIVYLLIYLVVISVSAFFLLVEYWYLWGLTVIAGLVFLVNWYKRRTVYSCPKCDHVYEISILTVLLAPYGIDRDGAWLLQCCPSCHERYKNRVLKRV